MAHVNRTTRWLRAAIVVPAALIAAPMAHAATTTDTMGISATVLTACTLGTTSLAFGNYDPTSATDTDATATLTITCTTGTSFTVGLNAGTTSGTTVSTRKMANGANRLSYALYSNSGRTTNWGNTAGTDTPAAIVASSTASTMTVYGRVTALQNVPAGAYSDTVTVTVNY
jgi:spore coat protein U-like protein